MAIQVWVNCRPFLIVAAILQTFMPGCGVQQVVYSACSKLLVWTLFRPVSNLFKQKSNGIVTCDDGEQLDQQCNIDV